MASRTSQPQQAGVINRANPITNNIVVAFNGGVTKDYNNVTSKQMTVSGTRTNAGYRGVNVGFNATFGNSSADIITTDSTVDSAKRSWFARVYVQATNTSRIFEKGTNGGAIGGDGAGNIIISRAYSGGQSPLYGFVPVLNEWFNLLVTWDSSGSDIPKAYVNGIDTFLINSGTPPSGTLVTTSSAVVIGNRPDLARSWDGMISCAYVWDRILSPNEALELHRNPWQVFATKDILYADLISANIPFSARAPYMTGVLSIKA